MRPLHTSEALAPLVWPLHLNETESSILWCLKHDLNIWKILIYPIVMRKMLIVTYYKID